MIAAVLEHRAAEMRKFYAGLKFEHEPRPKHIFDGKRRSYYERFHPDKKIKTIFVPGLGMRSYRPIVGASPGTYYMRADGTAANKAAATDPSDPSTAMSIATVNGETFAGGDLLPMSDQGGVYRDQLDPPSDGGAGIQIAFQNISGEKPLITGADLVTGWTAEGTPNVWEASFAPTGTADNLITLIDGVLGIDAGSIAAITEALEWHYDPALDLLYVYSLIDPDTAFTNPGVEAQKRELAFYSNSRTYLTVDGIDLQMGWNETLKWDGGHSSVTKNLDIAYSGETGLLVSGTHSNPIIQNVRSHHNGTIGEDHGFYFRATTTNNGPFLVEDCQADHNAGYGFHMFEGRGGTLRRCIGFESRLKGDFLINNIVENENITLEYCAGRTGGGAAIMSYRIRNLSGTSTVKILNCVGYLHALGVLEIDSLGVATTTVEAKNCIWWGDTAVNVAMFVGAGLAATINLENNCYLADGGDMITYDGVTYSQAEFADYQSASGQDAQSISSDPLFVDKASFDFHLLAASPCIDAGVDVGLDRDFDGISVPQGDAPDMGIYEFEQAEAPGSVGVRITARIKIEGDFVIEGEREMEQFWSDYFANAEAFSTALSKVSEN